LDFNKNGKIDGNVFVGWIKKALNLMDSNYGDEIDDYLRQGFYDMKDG